jgi:hypothetical protein
MHNVEQQHETHTPLQIILPCITMKYGHCNLFTFHISNLVYDPMDTEIVIYILYKTIYPVLGPLTISKSEGKATPLQALTGPEGSSRLRLQS